MARFEAHGGSRRNVQAIPKCYFSIKGESGVAFSEMVMTADLDRSVASVCDFESDGSSVLVQDNVAGCCEDLARYHNHVLLNSFDSLCDLHSYPLFSDQPFNRLLLSQILVWHYEI